MERESIRIPPRSSKYIASDRVSPKNSGAKALESFSGYRAAQEAAQYEERLKLDKTECVLSSTVCERCRLGCLSGALVLPP